MLNAILQALKAHLEGLEIFKAVSTSVKGLALNQPPSVVVWLGTDKPGRERPKDTRDINWNVLLCLPNLDKKYSPYVTIDTVRAALTQWLAFKGGILPATVNSITFQGFENNMILFMCQLTTQVIPESFDPEKLIT